MRELDKDKIQVRYITGINRTMFNYPTPLDVLYDSCTLSVDDRLFSRAKIENTYFRDDTDRELTEKKIDRIIGSLLEDGYIEESGNHHKIVRTPWD